MRLSYSEYLKQAKFKKGIIYHYRHVFSVLLLRACIFVMPNCPAKILFIDVIKKYNEHIIEACYKNYYGPDKDIRLSYDEKDNLIIKYEV